MDLKGAEIRDIFSLCKDMGSNINEINKLKVNIPFYQRPYRWGNEQIKNLICDFYNNQKANSQDGYFIGSVVLVDNPSNTYDIIDGQQRITTVFLLGYLKFLVQRARIEELILRKNPNIIDKLNDLVDLYTQIIGYIHVDEFKKMKKDIESYLDNLDETNRDEIYEKIEKIYCNCVGLPLNKDLSNMDTYLKEYNSLQEMFLKNDKLGITYSRAKYNEDIKNALKRVCILVSKDNGLTINILGKAATETIEDYLDRTTEIEKNSLQYLFSIIYEYNNLLNNITLPTDNLVKVGLILDNITEILKNLKFCVIMTGNEKDAYTLFEVLNDRALEIDDLELMKNSFFKIYCLTSNDTSALIDRNIDELDRLWSEEIFVRDLSDTTRKEISFWGTVFLTGNTDITTKQIAKYREPLESKYLSNYSTQKNNYKINIAKNDIEIYQMVKNIIEIYGIHVRNTANDCIEAERNNETSVTYKTMHFLNALKQTGVMAALINYIIGYYINKHNKENMDIDDFGTFIKELGSSKNNYQYSDINSLAHKLWQVSMLSDSYKNSRDYANEIISKVNRSSIDLKIQNLDMLKLKKEFKEWAKDKCYGNKDKELKIKILFIRLLRTSKINSQLKLNTAQYTFTTANLQLDHLEAKNIDSNNSSAYFEPKSKGITREKFINGLGNLMLLDAKNNNNKDNKPLYCSMKNYNNMCSHWIVDEIKDMLQNSRFSSIISGNDRKPNEEFFIERTTRLIEYFYKLIEADFNATKIELH